jgi:hypothetical protein
LERELEHGYGYGYAHDRVMIMLIVLVIGVTTTFNEHNDEYYDIYNDDDDAGDDIDCAVIRHGRIRSSSNIPDREIGDSLRSRFGGLIV